MLKKYTGHTICASQKAVVTVIYLNENCSALTGAWKSFSIKFPENLFSGTWVVTCSLTNRWTVILIGSAAMWLHLKHIDIWFA